MTLRREKPPEEDSAISKNQYTVGLVTGEPNSTEFAIAEDFATVVASRQETSPHAEVALRVLPMVGNGGVRNLTDVLTLAGADFAIAPVILVDRPRGAKTIGNIGDKLAYIAPLYIEESNLLARPEIKSLADLEGRASTSAKKVVPAPSSAARCSTASA